VAVVSCAEADCSCGADDLPQATSKNIAIGMIIFFMMMYIY
jgi:hypothetical protein